jgi:hypothetical protein
MKRSTKPLLRRLASSPAVLEGGEDGEFACKGGSRRLDGSGVDAGV